MAGYLGASTWRYVVAGGSAESWHLPRRHHFRLLARPPSHRLTDLYTIPKKEAMRLVVFTLFHAMAQ